MKWCEAVGTEPYLCLNFGTGTLDEGNQSQTQLVHVPGAHMTTALGWLEYCNSDRPTYYANLRRKNGREKPYNVSCFQQSTKTKALFFMAAPFTS
jgi:alpha-N-arabinofuranosidase